MKVRFLHISDLHLTYHSLKGDDWAVQAIHQDVVVHSMLDAIQKIVVKDQPPDFIILTGDITRSSEREEYDVALAFCNRLLDITGLPASRLYPVPGNHDIDRTVVKKSHQHRFYAFESQDDITELLTDQDLFSIVMRKFKEFNVFAEKAMQRRHFDDDTYHIVESLHIEKQGVPFRVNLAGLNSALLGGYDGDDQQRLALGRYQVDRALNQLDEKALFSIAFFHHPFEAFHQADKICETRLKQKIDIILTGHLHQPNGAVIHDVTSKAIVLGAGASFDSREKHHSFNWVEIDLHTGKGKVQFYKYLPDHHLWKKDTDTCPETEDGHFPFVINAIKENPVPPPKKQKPEKPKEALSEPDSAYDIFISYNRADAQWVKEKLVDILSGCERDDGQQLRIFHDIDSIKGGEQWLSTIARGIEHCRRFVPVYSPDFFQSEMCEYELTLAHSRDPSQKKGIIVPVMYRQTEIPFEYRPIQFIDAEDETYQDRLFRDLGVQQAFGKSKAQILHYDPDQSLPEQSPTTVRFIHDYLLPDTFTARTNEIARLRNLIAGHPDTESQKMASIVTVRALGGTGKSCLIRKVVEEFRGESRFQYIIWFSFYEARTEDEGYFFKKVLENLNGAGLPEADQDEISANLMREHLCRYLERQPVLLVLDGLEVIQETEKPDPPRYGHMKAAYQELSKFMAHLCNQSCSTAIVTTRVSLNEFSGVSGYLDILLGDLSLDAGAELLKRLKVEGTDEDRLQCVRILGGHPLCLKAAGKYMHLCHIPAAKIEQITGKADVFQRSTEGERVRRIVDNYKSALNDDQRYFLQMLSLHPHAITERNFPILVQNYKKRPMDHPAGKTAWVLEKIIDPLVQKDLIETLTDTDKQTSFSAHPLMKLAFATWMQADDKQAAHRQWADAAKTSPDISYSASSANSLEALQPYLDIVDHYLEGNDPKAAWDIYRGRYVDSRLDELGYAHRQLEYGRRFEAALKTGGWSPGSKALIYLYDYMARGFIKLNQPKEYSLYSEKHFAAAQETGDKEQILIYGSILADSYLKNGQVHQAKEKLMVLKKMLADIKDGSSTDIYQFVMTKTELFSANYSKAIELMKHKPKYSGKYNLILHNLYLAEALTRNDQLTEAREELEAALDLAESQHIHTLIPAIFERFTWLFLKQNDLHRAREFNDRRIALKKSLNLPYTDDGFLLVAEGQYDRAIQKAMPYISVDGDEKIDKENEIMNLIILARAWNGKGDAAKATEMLERAEALMAETGCWLEKDRLRLD